MPKLDVTRVLSAEYLLGLFLSLTAAYAAFSSWKADAEIRIKQMEERYEIQRQDHDALIALQADVRSIKDSVTKIERVIIFKKEANAN